MNIGLGSWIYIENNIEHEVGETEYYRYLIRKIAVVLNTQDTEKMLYLLWDLEEFVEESLSAARSERINRFISLVKNRIYGSNTPAERYLLWLENLDRVEETVEETIEEQRNRIWQQAMSMVNLEVDGDRSASPAA